MLKTFLKYLAVGTLNGIIYFILLYLFTDVLKLWYMISAVISVILQTLITFSLHRIWTWGHKKTDIKSAVTLYRFIKYLIVGGMGMVFGLGLLYVITEYFNQWYMVGAFIASYLLLIVTFFINNYWTWNDDKRGLGLIVLILDKLGITNILKLKGVAD